MKKNNKKLNEVVKFVAKLFMNGLSAFAIGYSSTSMYNKSKDPKTIIGKIAKYSIYGAALFCTIMYYSKTIANDIVDFDEKMEGSNKDVDDDILIHKLGFDYDMGAFYPSIKMSCTSRSINI